MALLEVGRGADAGAASAWKGRSIDPCDIGASKRSARPSSRWRRPARSASDWSAPASPTIRGSATSSRSSRRTARAVDLVATRRQPDARLVAGSRAAATGRSRWAGSRHRAAAPRHPKADHRRADHDRVRPDTRPRHPQSQDLLHDRQPTETMDDIAAIPALAGRMLERLRVLDRAGRPSAASRCRSPRSSPSPGRHSSGRRSTARSLQTKLETIKRGVRAFSNVRVLHENPREAALQACWPGDRRVGDFSSSRRRTTETGGGPSGSGRRSRALHHATPVARRAAALGSLRRRVKKAGSSANGSALRRERRGHLPAAASQSPHLGHDRCNLRCAYCMPEEDTSGFARAYLEVRGSQRAGDVFMDLGVDKIRLTAASRSCGATSMAHPTARGEARLRDLAITTTASCWRSRRGRSRRPASIASP